MRATLSVAGLYIYDNTIFNRFALPDNISRDTVVNTILYETQELECAIPDPDRLREAIETWSTKQLPIWIKLQNTLNYEYDPIYNYDRTEEETIAHTGGGSDISSGGDTTNDFTAGFNDSGTFANVPASKTTTDLGSTVTRTNNYTDIRSHRAYGNIGVTTTQQMIEQEREVVKFSIIDYIVSEFKNQFCLLIY